MKTFIGLVQHEFMMSIRRKSLWIGFSIVTGLFVFAFLLQDPEEGRNFFTSGNSAWQEAGDMVYMFNMLMPLVAGVLSSDRLQRDFLLGVRELQKSAPQTDGLILAAKFTGVLVSMFVPFLISVIGLGLYAVISGVAAGELLVGILAGFLTIALPSFVFVVAFSLVCPLVIPVRVYQILFTGYWFWGNFLSEKVFPTISGTLLNSSGIYPMQGFFYGSLSRTGAPLHTPFEACLNIVLLLACAGAALASARYYLSHKAAIA